MASIQQLTTWFEKGVDLHKKSQAPGGVADKVNKALNLWKPIFESLTFPKLKAIGHDIAKLKTTHGRPVKVCQTTLMDNF